MLLKVDVAIRKDKKFQSIHEKILLFPNYREYMKDNEQRCEITIQTAYDFLVHYEDLAELYKKAIGWKDAKIWVFDNYIERPLSILFKEIEKYVRHKFKDFPSQTILGQTYEQWLLKR